MEGRRELDSAGRTAHALLILALGCGAASGADEIERGTELARAGRSDEARAEFLAGARNAPRDKRFPLELAGLAYRAKNFPAARRYLRQALELDPADGYGNDFLGTIDFLEGNLEAALASWNRIGKPRLEEVKVAPAARLNPVLLDSALTIAPGSLLTLDQFRTAAARLEALDVFDSYRLDVSARTDERFEATLHWFQPPAWMKAASMFRGLAYQTMQPELRNIGGTGVNWTNLLRWDAQKRRVATSVEGPIRRHANWRYRWYGDARRETWNAGGLEDFRLQRIASGAEFQSIPSWRVSWRTGFEVSSRHYGNLAGFQGGMAAKYRAGLTYELLRVPERRITVGSGAAWELGRMLSGARESFSHGQVSLAARWLPKAQGDDYRVNAQVRAGGTLGKPPFDELFMLGVERDNDLWLRGHAGTMEGKKGSAPVGRNYLLMNWDIHKEIYRNAFFTIEAAPFVDAARTQDVFGRPGLRSWLVDTGAEGSVRIPGGLRATLIYGRSLRGDAHALYATIGK